MGINQFDPYPDPHFQFLCEHGATGSSEFERQACEWLISLFQSDSPQ